MATILSLLSDATLEKFIRSLKMREDDKKFLLSKVPHLDFEQRRALFETLFQIYILDLQEKKTLEGMKRMKTLFGKKEKRKK